MAFVPGVFSVLIATMPTIEGALHACQLPPKLVWPLRVMLVDGSRKLACHPLCAAL